MLSFYWKKVKLKQNITSSSYVKKIYQELFKHQEIILSSSIKKNHFDIPDEIRNLSGNEIYFRLNQNLFFSISNYQTYNDGEIYRVKFLSKDLENHIHQVELDSTAKKHCTYSIIKGNKKEVLKDEDLLTLEALPFLENLSSLKAKSI